jgi:hypothetical protein
MGAYLTWEEKERTHGADVAKIEKGFGSRESGEGGRAVDLREMSCYNLS